MPSGKSYLYYNGSGFEWKSPDGSTGGGTADLSEYSWWGRKFDPASKSITGEMSSVTCIEFQSTNGETVIRKKLHLDKNGDLCFDGNLYATGGITALGVGTTTGGGSSSSSRYPFTIYNGSSDNDYITYDGSSSAYLRFKSGFSISKTGLGYEISVSGGGSGGSIQVAQTPEYAGESENWVSTTKLRFVGITGTKPTIRTNSEKSCVDVGIPVGGGSGSSGTTAGKLRFYQDSSEETWNGESDFKIIFGSGINVTWDSHSQITLSALGGSGGSTSTSVSWSDVTNKPSTFTPSSHTHSTSDINGLSNYVRGITVNNADKATQLANPRLIWGQSFNGTGDINGNLKMGSAGGGSIQLWMNNGNMLDRTNNILHIGYGLKESSDAEINLDAYATKVYTDNMSKHYDFKSNVFDVNSNQIHFGSETNGGKISWDAANKAFKIEGNIYATGGITALGVSNNATTSNNVDFTFKSVTANTFNVIDSIQLSDSLILNRIDSNVYLASTDVTQASYIYLDGNDQNYYLSSQGDAYFNSLNCDIFNFSGVTNFEIVDANDTGFNIQFNYNGKTYKFFPSENSVTVS